MKKSDPMEASNMLTITTKHARKCGFCSRGIKEHCERYGLDFKKFILKGLPEEQLAATGNHYMAKMIEAAHKEQEEGA
jgi:hypothetical protein